MILLRIFKNARVAGMAGVIIFGVALFMISFTGKTAPLEFPGMPFYELIFGAIHRLPFLNRIVTLLLVLLLCFILFRIGLHYFLLDNRSYMPAFFFLFIVVVLPGAHQVTPALVGSVFYLLCFAILFGLHDDPPDTFRVFHASLVLALGSMFYMKLIWFVPLIWISLGTLRSVTLRELFYPVIAYLLLLLFLLSWYWGIRDDAGTLGDLLRENLSFRSAFIVRHFSVYAYYGYLLLLVLLASVYMVNRFQARKTYIQNIYQVMFYQFVAGILFFMFIARFSITGVVYIAFPVTFILSYYFHRRKNPWIHELALWIMVAGAVFVQVMRG